MIRHESCNSSEISDKLEREILSWISALGAGLRNSAWTSVVLFSPKKD